MRAPTAPTIRSTPDDRDWWDDSATSTRGGGGGGGGSGGGLLTDGDTNLVVEDDVSVAGVANTTQSPIDRFGRVATPPTPVAGASFSVSSEQYGIEQQMVGTFSGGVYVPGIPTTPVLYGVPSYGPQHAIDKAGWYNHPHSGTSCGVGLGAQDGWFTKEFWRKVTVPAPPAGSEGFFVTVAWGASAATGAGWSYPCYLHAASTAPASLNHGTAIGPILPGVDNTLYVPAGFVPAGGGDVWLGFLPGWRPPHSWDPGWFCYYDPPEWVALNGSRDGFPLTAFAWATAAGPLDLGSASSDEDAAWGEASWEWQVVGVEGGPTYGIDGEAFYVTATGPEGVGISVVGDGEDDGADAGPWNSGSIEIEFSTTAVGGSIEVAVVGAAAHSVGTLDLTDPASITAAGPTSTDTASFDLDVDTRYRASFDPRSGEIVGKVWRVLDGEPADVAVITAIDESGDVGDHLTLWVRADDQTIRIHSIEVAPAAESGERVDHEWLGFASGDTDRFRNRQRYRAGTLVAHINGIDATPIWEDGIEFRLDAFPTAASGIYTSYIAE